MERNASLSKGKNTLQILHYFTFLNSFIPSDYTVYNKYFSNGTYKGKKEVQVDGAWYNIDGSVNTAGLPNWMFYGP